MGKTQLAIAYAKQHKDKYSAIFWIDIRDKNTLIRSFLKVAKQIKRQHPLPTVISGVSLDNNAVEEIEAVKAWLSMPGNTRWLLIYDNYDNPRIPNYEDPASIDISEYLPEAYQGSVVVTTRSF